MENGDGSVLGWVGAGVVAVVSTLAGAVSFLFKKIESKNAASIQKLEQRSEECEKDRATMRVRIAKLETVCGIKQEEEV